VPDHDAHVEPGAVARGRVLGPGRTRHDIGLCAAASRRPSRDAGARAA
jgi:hypothetical protein